MRENKLHIEKEISWDEIDKSIEKYYFESSLISENNNKYAVGIATYLTDIMHQKGYSYFKNKDFLFSVMKLYSENSEFASPVNLICIFELSILAEQEEYFFEQLNLMNDLERICAYYFSKLLDLYTKLKHRKITSTSQFKVVAHEYSEFQFLYDILNADVKKYTDELDSALENFFITSVSSRIQIVEGLYLELHGEFKNAAVLYASLFKIALVRRQKNFLIDRIGICLDGLSLNLEENEYIIEEIMSNIIASISVEDTIVPSSSITLKLSKISLKKIPPRTFVEVVTQYYSNLPISVRTDDLSNPCLLSLVDYFKAIADQEKE